MKFNVKKDLKESVQKEDAGGKDPRILPYYNMKTGDKLKVLIVPDVNGEPWANYSLHGPNLKVKGIQAIRCPYKAGAGDCPICSKGFDLLDEDKAEAKRRFAKDYALASVIVLETPIEIPESDDGNVIKLWHMPYAVQAMIKEQIKEGQITNETLTTTPLVIKKTENKGGNASYEHSFFDRETLDEEELDELLEDEVVEQFDYSKLDDVIKPIVDEEELEEWLVKAEEKDSKSKEKGSGSGKKRTTKSLKDRMNKKDSSDEEEEEDTQKEEQEVDTEEEEDGRSPDEQMDEKKEDEEKKSSSKKSSGGSALRERLRKRNNK
jgi:hypothetical protein